MTESSWWDRTPPETLPPFPRQTLLETAVDTVETVVETVIGTVVTVFNTLNPLHKENENE